MSHLGGYRGGDPRLFHPDPEMSTPAEMANHEAACRAWARGDQTEPATELNGVHPDGVRFHASIRPFGIGFTDEPNQEVDNEQEPDLPLDKLEDEELYGLYLSNAGPQSDEAMLILARRHHTTTDYEDDPADRIT